MTMRQDQIKYARERITAVREARLDEAKNRCTVAQTVLSDSQKIRAIRDGEAYLKSSVKASDTIGTAFNFTNVTKVATLDGDAYKKLADPIRKKAAEALDQLILGNGEDALKLINAFLK